MTRLLILDTETGGLDPQAFSLLSIGLVVWEDGHLKQEEEIFVLEPDLRCDPESMAVNGIDLEHLRSIGLSPDKAAARLDRFLASHFPIEEHPRITVGGHNVAFDVDYIKRLYRLAGSEGHLRFSYRMLDTAGIVQFLVLAGRLPMNIASSTSAFQHFGIQIEHGKRHSALADAKATGELLTKLLAMV